MCPACQPDVSALSIARRPARVPRSRLTSRRGQEHPSRADDRPRADLRLGRGDRADRRHVAAESYGIVGMAGRVASRACRAATGSPTGIEVEGARRRHRDRPPRRRRVRAQPRRGRGDRAQPRRLRGRAADGPLGRRRRGAHRGRQALDVRSRPRPRDRRASRSRNLEANRQRIDDLNVYPVPDGDTGTNLTLTVRAIVEALEKSTRDGHEAVARELSRAALMGARGNSGVIFSQIVRGFADVLGEHDPIDERCRARRFAPRATRAYRAVRRPVEGTMLTVIREMAEEAESPEARGLDRRRAARASSSPAARSRSRGRRSCSPCSSEAGVVDAGGAGLSRSSAASAPRVAGRAAAGGAGATPGASARARSTRSCPSSATAPSSWSRATGSTPTRSSASSSSSATRCSSSATRAALKVHVHTDDPGARAQLGTRASGRSTAVEIADMHRQTLEREERLAQARSTACRRSRRASSRSRPGTGNRRLFESLRATRVIEGGQTMNPSDRRDRRRRRCHPGHRGDRAAEQLERASSAPSRRSALATSRCGSCRPVGAGGARRDVAYDAERSARRERERDGARRSRASPPARSRSPRATSTLDGVEVRKGAWLGLADGARRRERARASTTVAGAVAERLLDGGREILTLLTGADEPRARRARRASSARAIPRSRSRSTRAASRTTRCSSRRSERCGARCCSSRTTRSTARRSSCCSTGATGIEVVGAVADGREAAAAAERLAPDVVLMDFRLPGLDGAEATAAVLAAAPARRDRVPDGRGDRRRARSACSRRAPSALIEKGELDRRARRRAIHAASRARRRSEP